MLSDYLFQLNRDLNQYSILLSFSGPFYQGIIEEIGLAIRGYVKLQQDNKSLISNVFTVFIEMSQNIKNYLQNEEDPLMVSSGIIVIGKMGDSFFVRSGNLIRNQDRDKLEQTIVSLRDLNKDDLKSLYKEKIRKAIVPGSQGAGLGLIELSRKAQQPLDFSFHPVDEKYSFYSLNVSL